MLCGNIKELLSKILLKLNCSINLVESIPLSRFTIARRVAQLGISVDSAIKERIKNCEFYSFCIDETTDINDFCQLLICVRCVDKEYNVFETMFSLETFYGNVTGKLLFALVCEKLLSIIDPKKFVGVCTDGANVMSGKNEGFVRQLKKHGFDVNTFHCIIHQAALSSKFINDFPAMKTAEQIINKIRGGHHSLSHRKFVSFLKTKNALHNDLKMFTEVRWLSRGNCLNRLFELREEVVQFLEVEQMDKGFSDSLKDCQFISDLAFLSDITTLLNNFNLKLQEIKMGDYTNFSKTYFILSQQKNVCTEEYINMFETLFFNFQDMFKDFDVLKPFLELFEAPFKVDVTNYELKIQMELIFLRSEITEQPFDDMPSFWKSLDELTYPELKNNALKIMSLFPSTYMCEQIFSDLKFICSKQRNKLSSEQLKHILLLRNCHKSISINTYI